MSGGGLGMIAVGATLTICVGFVLWYILKSRHDWWHSDARWWCPWCSYERRGMP